MVCGFEHLKVINYPKNIPVFEWSILNSRNHEHRPTQPDHQILVHYVDIDDHKYPLFLSTFSSIDNLGDGLKVNLELSARYQDPDFQYVSSLPFLLITAVHRQSGILYVCGGWLLTRQELRQANPFVIFTLSSVTSLNWLL